MDDEFFKKLDEAKDANDNVAFKNLIRGKARRDAKALVRRLDTDLPVEGQHLTDHIVEVQFRAKVDECERALWAEFVWRRLYGPAPDAICRLLSTSGPDEEEFFAKQRVRARLIRQTRYVEQDGAAAILGCGVREIPPMALVFIQDLTSIYPLFQFDRANHRIWPVMVDVISAKPRYMSNFDLLHWMIADNAELGTPPSEMIDSSPSEVFDAFLDFIGEPEHG